MTGAASMPRTNSSSSPCVPKAAITASAAWMTAEWPHSMSAASSFERLGYCSTEALAAAVLAVAAAVSKNPVRMLTEAPSRCSCFQTQVDELEAEGGS